MNALIFALFDSNGLNGSNFTRPPSANETPGVLDESCAVVASSTPMPLLRTETSIVPTSPSSRMPS